MKLLTAPIALFLLAFITAPFTVHAQEASEIEGMPAGLYKLDKTHASIVWKVSHLGLSNYTARFTDFDVDLLFDNEKPENSKIIATIDPTSIKTDYPHPEKKDFDKKLVEGSGWFNTTQFPEIKFKSTSVKKTGDETADVTGDLTFLGVTKPVTLNVAFNKAIGNHPFANKPALGFSATGSLKRSDFGMTKYLPNIGDDVELLIEAEFLHEEHNVR